MEESEPIDTSKLRKKFSGDEDLDTKTMRIMDMVYYNPKKGQMLTKKPVDKGEKTEENEQEDKGKKKENTVKKSAETTAHEIQQPTRKPSAPQVKIGADGNIILDETSLVVQDGVESSAWETVDGNSVNFKTTSLSYRNRLWRKGTPWTAKETELFYEIIRCTGPDFSLMHQYFPKRARLELKSKYNREEKNNWSKLKDTMSKPLALDDSLNIRVERLQKEIKEEAERSKEKMKRRKEPDNRVDIDWDESTADLIIEAEQVIQELEKEARWTDQQCEIENFENSKHIKKKPTLAVSKAMAIVEKHVEIVSRTAAITTKTRGYDGFKELSDNDEDICSDLNADPLQIVYSGPTTKNNGTTTYRNIRNLMKELPKKTDRILRSSTRQGP